MVASLLLVVIGQEAGTFSYNNKNEVEIKKEEASPFEFKVLKIERSQGLDYDKPKLGYEYVIMNLSFLYSGEADYYSFGVSDFNLKVENGDVFETTFSAVNNDTRFYNYSIMPGEIFKGSIVFEIPKSSKIIELLFLE
jgi:hypothetical protein